MHGFAIIIGSCLIKPTSPLVALILVSWMYGTSPNLSYEDYKNSYIQNGGERVDFIEKCFKEWK